MTTLRADCARPGFWLRFRVPASLLPASTNHAGRDSRVRHRNRGTRPAHPPAPAGARPAARHAVHAGRGLRHPERRAAGRSARSLGFSLAHLQWIATSFALCAAGFTLFFGRVARPVRPRAGCSSAAWRSSARPPSLGGLAQNPGDADRRPRPPGPGHRRRDAGRAVAADHRRSRRARCAEKALGLNGALMSSGFTAGAILGGVLTDLLSWRWAFFINVPVALAVLFVAPSGAQGVPARPAPRSSTCPAPSASPSACWPSSSGSPRRASTAGAPPAALLLARGRRGAAGASSGPSSASSARRSCRSAVLRKRSGRLGQLRRPDRVPHRDLAGLPADPVPAEGARLLRARRRPVLRLPRPGHRHRRSHRPPKVIGAVRHHPHA